MPALNESMAALVIADEPNAARFEQFCVDQYSTSEGLTVLPTSKVWDHGRDGRSLGKQSVFLCATITKDLPDKVKADIQRLVASVIPETIAYCASQSLTEDAEIKLKAEILKLSPQTQHVHVLGAVQLARMAVRNSETIERYYRSELSNLREARLDVLVAEDNIESTGLRLALGIQLQPDAHGLRDEACGEIALQLLGKGRQLSLSGITKGISDYLRLSRHVNEHFVRTRLSRLEEQGLIQSNDATFELTNKGKARLQESQSQAVESLLEGRSLLRQDIHVLSGITLSEDQYGQLWSIIQSELANAFLLHGLAIIEAVSGMIGQKQSALRKAEVPDVVVLLESIASKAATVAGAKEQQVAVRQALLDMWFDARCKAAGWLSQICVTYVSLCSLGLDVTAADQIRKALIQHHLAPDTDIALSLLCSGEHNHQAIEAFFNEWKRLGGVVVLTNPVAHELAYHAWISRIDYNGVKHTDQSKTPEEVEALIENAFVRAYWVESKHQFSDRFWNAYIAGFIGKTPYDSARIEKALIKTYGWQHRQPDISPIDDLNDKIRDRLLDIRTRRDESKVGASRPRNMKLIQDKCQRDADLLCSLLVMRREEAAKGTDVDVVAVSSSPRLYKVAHDFEAELGQPSIVLPFEGVTYLLSLIPGTSIGVRSLEKLLFDPPQIWRMSPLVRLAMRVISQSKEYVLPFSQRAALDYNLRIEIRRVAEEQGRRISEVTEQLYYNPALDVETLTEVIQGAVDKLAASRTEKERDALRARLKELGG